MLSMNVLMGALELGCIYSLVALALFLSFRILNIADMTTDGSFTLGCAVSAVFAVSGHPVLGPLPCRPAWEFPLFWRALSPTPAFIR